MSKNPTPIIKASELLSVHQAENLVLVDASNGTNARSNYDKGHLDGALFVDLNTQLADIKEDVSDGGRHPLPTVEAFSKTLSELGISPETHVVIYDDKNGSNAAARFWWMLASIGHKHVQVLDGGFQAAAAIGFPVNSNKVVPKPAKPYEIENWMLPTADISEVAAASQTEGHIVIDVRDADRFNGYTEPIDLVAGHIPGAVNIPLTENLDNDGLFLPPAELKAKYEAIFGNLDNENVIVHCGSGVTACHTLLALAYAGMEIPKLYVGSWSEWSRNGRPIGKNAERR